MPAFWVHRQARARSIISPAAAHLTMEELPEKRPSTSTFLILSCTVVRCGPPIYALRDLHIKERDFAYYITLTNVTLSLAASAASRQLWTTAKPRKIHVLI